MKLQDLKTSGIIPKTLPDNVFLFLCYNKLGIGKHGMDMNFEINAEQLEKILYSADLNNYKIKGEMEAQHNSVIDRYQKLITGYEDMIAGIQGNPAFTSEVAALTSLVNNLKSEKVSYQQTVAGFQASNSSKYFDFDENKTEASKKIIEAASNLSTALKDKVTNTDKDLNKLYSKLDKAQARNPKMLSGKIRNAMKIKSLQSKINRLRTKKGKLQSIQRTVINARTNAYVNKMNNKFDKYMEEQSKIAEAIESKKELLDEIDEYKAEQTAAQEDYLEAIADKASARGLGKVGANMRLKGAEKYNKRVAQKIIELQKKNGKVDIPKQFCDVITRSYQR